MSFGAYFNAFAAGYWRHWTPLTEVRLKLRLRGQRARRRLPQQGRRRADPRARRRARHAAACTSVDVALDLRPFEDGGWYWFDLTTDDGDAHPARGRLARRRVEAPGTAAVTIGMPTFNRPADCVATLTAIGEDPLVLAAVHQVILPDQGTQQGARRARVRRGGGRARRPAADHRPAQPRRLRRLRPRHVRGAGDTRDCQQILFMDDDILLEPDSVLRAVAFSRFAREPMLVGGQMLSLQARSQLSTMGEVVDRHKFLWRNAPQTEPHHDLAERPLRQTAVAAPAGGRRLQRLVDVPDPAGRRRGRRAAAAAVHQVGRRRVRPARPRRAATARRRCRASRSGTCRSWRRTTPATGRPTSTTATGSSPPRCTARTTRRRCSPTSSSAPCGT